MFNYVFNLDNFEQMIIKNCMLPSIYELCEVIYYVQSEPYSLTFVTTYKATKKLQLNEFRLTLLGN